MNLNRIEELELEIDNFSQAVYEHISTYFVYIWTQVHWECIFSAFWLWQELSEVAVLGIDVTWLPSDFNAHWKVELWVPWNRDYGGSEAVWPTHPTLTTWAGRDGMVGIPVANHGYFDQEV